MIIKLLKIGLLNCAEKTSESGEEKIFQGIYGVCNGNIPKSLFGFGSYKVKIRLDILNKISTILFIKPSDICTIAEQSGGEFYETKYNQLLDFIKEKQY